jgi:hypothetical protein
MDSADHDPIQLQQMRASFEAGLPNRVRRASLVKLQNIIPAHWFAAAASECVGMYIAGYFYGAISIAQAYVEALSCFLAKHHKVRVKNDPGERCRRLQSEKLISVQACDAALAILNGRNHFHHLNRQVEQEYQKLETRAKECINHLHTIESEVFAYSFGDEPGKVILKKPEYWPLDRPGLAQVNLRQLW